MAQNIYDNPEFFAGYARLRRSVEGLAGAPEWPALRALVPDLRGSTVLDLGCGFGWFCRWARAQGAAHVHGIDLSANMLERAVAETADPAVTYQRADLEDLSLPETTFDVVYSSLALHYVARLEPLIAAIYRALVPGGRLVCSVEHPIYTAPVAPGWVRGTDGRHTWPVDSYLDEGPRRTDWLTTDVIKQHRTLGTYINLLVQAGLTIRYVEEWGPTPEQIAANSDWEGERDRPMFLLFAAAR